MTPVPKGDWLLGSVFWLSAPAFLWGTYKYNRNTSEFIDSASGRWRYINRNPQMELTLCASCTTS